MRQPAVTEPAEQRQLALRELPHTVRELAQESLDYFEPRLAEVIGDTLQTLFQLAEDSDDPDERRRQFDAARLLQRRKDDVLGAFTEGFLSAFTPQPRERGKGRRSPAGELDHVEVLSGDAFDLSVAVSTVTSRSASRHKRFIEELTPALTEASSGSHFTTRRNPLSVFRITSAFMAAIGRIELDASVQRMLLDEFETRVIDPLEDLYSRVSSLLDLGVYAPGGECESSAGDGIDQPAPPPSQSVGFDDLRQLVRGCLGAARGSRSPATAANGSDHQGAAAAHAVSSSRLFEALSEAESELHQRLAGDAPNLRAVAESALARRGDRLSQVEERALDNLQLVSLLFEHILRDESVSLPMVWLISRLQLPTLKVAMEDASLFEDPDHVVRRVINRLVEVGIGWPADSEVVRKDPLYGSIEVIVTRIVEEVHANLDVFADIEPELDSAIGRSQSRARNLEDRLGQRESGKAKVMAARKVVQDHINGRAAGIKLPDELRRYVENVWSQVLVYLCVRFGTDSEQWHSADKAFGELLRLGQPAGSVDDIGQREQRLPKLLDRHEHWLQTAGIDPSQAEARLQRLYGAFEELACHDRAWFESSTEYEVEAIEEMELIEMIAPEEAESPALDAELEALLEPLSPGTWLELRDGGAEGVRCKLSLVFEPSRNHLFVDYRGMRVRELPARDVAEGLRDGRIQKLATDPVVERALDEMIRELKDQIEAGAEAAGSRERAAGPEG